MRRIALIALAASLPLLAACEPSKQEIIRKSETIESKQELRSVLGDPDDIAKFGPIEKWTYEAEDGRVVFLIAGDTVTLQATETKAR